jgi:hypothetical protein
MPPVVSDAADHDEERRRLEALLECGERLYELGEKPEGAGLTERVDIQSQLAARRPPRHEVREPSR